MEAKIVKIREQTVHDFDAVLDDSMIAIMGDLSSPERRKALKLVLQNLGTCVNQVKADRRPRSVPKAKTDHTSKSAPKPAEKPAQTAANIPTAKSVDTSAQTAVKAPVGIQPAPAPKATTQPVQATAKPPVNAQPVPPPKQVEQSTQKVVESTNARPDSGVVQPSKMPDKPLIHGKLRMNNRLGKYGIWDKDADDWYVPSITVGMDFEISPNYRMWFTTRTAIGTKGEGKGKIVFPINTSDGLVEIFCFPKLPIRSILPGNSVMYGEN